MSTILIDRKLLQRVLDAYLDLLADDRAFTGIAQSGILKHPEEGQRYFEAHEIALDKELSGMEGLRTALHDKIQKEFDAAFLSKLLPEFSAYSRRRYSKRQRTKSPPQG